MNIEKLARNAINYIDKTWGLPKKGFIAGGSIANLIWEQVSGNKAVINDIDIFLLENILEKRDFNKNNLFSYKNVDKILKYDDYGGLRFHNIEKNFYSITSSEKEGIFNYIKYDSDIEDRKIIIDSFDLNCVMIGYSIEDDKFIWSKSFEDFIINKKIKIINALTPHHTAIRIVKKSKEMCVEIEYSEIEILEYVMGSMVYDVIKHRFMDRYYEMFCQYQNDLQMFDIVKDIDGMKIIKENHQIDATFWTLIPKVIKNIKQLGYKGHQPSSNDILFYFRKIKNNDKLNKAWLLLSDIYTNEDYISNDYKEEDLTLLYNLYYNFPEAILNLRGHKFDEQIKLIKYLLSIFNDKSIVIALLQTNKITLNTDISEIEGMKLLLELFVRKYITIEHFIERVDNTFKNIENNSLPHLEDITFV